jgi:hypothetical protein
MYDRKMDVRIYGRRAAMFLSSIFLSAPCAGLRSVRPRNMCDSEKTMAEAIGCWQTLAIVPAEQSTAHQLRSTAHQHQLQKHTGKSTATSIQCSSEGIVPKWFSFVSANLYSISGSPRSEVRRVRTGASSQAADVWAAAGKVRTGANVKRLMIWPPRVAISCDGKT